LSTRAVPGNACAPSARGYLSEIQAMLSRRLRRNALRQAFHAKWMYMNFGSR